MQLKILGFSFNIKQAPVAIGINEVWSEMASTSTLEKDLHLRQAVIKVPVKTPEGADDTPWWAGILLRVRDSRLFTMLTENQGKQILTTEMLKDNQSLVEASFFVANPRTGAGLFAHHFQAAPLHSGLFTLFSNSFQALQSGEIRAATENEQLSDAERAQRILDLKGYIWPQQLVMEQGFKTLVASLKSVSTIKVRLATVCSAKTLFQGWGFMPERETCEFKIPKQALPEEIAECLDHALNSNQLTDARVSGITSNNTEMNVSKDKSKNPQVFDIQDYDSIMKGLELDITDYMKTLLQAKIIRHLISIARGRGVWQLLEKS